jgi:DNA-directed RNA polymerase specialized sigma24 family protein
VHELSDEALRALLIADRERGWRAFVDQYTETVLALVARAGVSDRDDAADVYLRVCERLAEDDCARLLRHDPGRGALAAWLTVVVRHVVVDWVRSRAGRRRLFRTIRDLEALDQRVFELYYWEHQRPVEIVEILRMRESRPVDLPEVLAALSRIQEAMTDRHRSELLALVARTRPAASLDGAESPARSLAAADDPERELGVRELDALFAAALAELPAEDAAIVRLTFVQGWSRERVRRGLHLERLTGERLAGILARLKELLTARRVGPREAATPGLRFLEDGS